MTAQTNYHTSCLNCCWDSVSTWEWRAICSDSCCNDGCNTSMKTWVSCDWLHSYSRVQSWQHTIFLQPLQLNTFIVATSLLSSLCCFRIASWLLYKQARKCIMLKIAYFTHTWSLVVCASITVFVVFITDCKLDWMDSISLEVVFIQDAIDTHRQNHTMMSQMNLLSRRCDYLIHY